MRKNIISIISLCVLLLVAFSVPVYAGVGIYPYPDSVKGTQYGAMEDVPPPIEKDGQTYYWSEAAQDYFLLTEDEEPPFPSMSDEALKQYLAPPPSYETSVKGIVEKDTLIYSGPSTSAMPFEDNGKIKGKTKVTIFYEELGYYFVESEKTGDRGYLPIDQVKITESGKKVVQKNLTALATSINLLGRTPQRQTYTVYSSMSTGSTIVGSIGGPSREIVDVNYLDSSGGVEWYNIRYKTPTSYKSGFIQKSNIYIPYFVDTNNNRLAKPISSGTYVWDYGVDGHAGVDIAGNGITVNAIAPGSMQYKASYDLVQISGVWKLKFKSYGRHAYWNTTVKNPSTGQTYSLQLVYAHLGSYSNNAYISNKLMPDGVTRKSFSLRYDNSDLLTEAASSYQYSEYADFDSIGSGIKTKSNLSAGYTLGTTGSTGNSGGPHLHFQVTSASSGNYDPFNYVLFPFADYEH